MRSSSFKLSTSRNLDEFFDMASEFFSSSHDVLLIYFLFEFMEFPAKQAKQKGIAVFLCQGKEVPRTSRCAFYFKYLKTASHELTCISQNLLRCTHCSGCVWRIPDIHKNTVSFYIFYISWTLCANKKYVKNSSEEKTLNTSDKLA